MPLITLSPLLLLITDSLAWLLFHLGISFGLRKVSDAFLNVMPTGSVLLPLKKAVGSGRRYFVFVSGKTNCPTAL